MFWKLTALSASSP
ncbi:hypothetical protein CISIN_1g0361042mg, partial [Citrus sinensis]